MKKDNIDVRGEVVVEVFHCALAGLLLILHGIRLQKQKDSFSHIYRDIHASRTVAERTRLVIKVKMYRLGLGSSDPLGTFTTRWHPASPGAILPSSPRV
jgi:hypothetical protein